MKIILTGSTGFIGSEVLTQCLSNPNITSIIALSRRPLPPSISSPKLQTIILDNFESYPQSTLSALSGAEACIWCLGKASATDEEARRTRIGYTTAAIEAFNQISKQLGPGKRFRFVCLSGRICERDQGKKLWYMQALRRIGGQVETNVLEFAERNAGSFEGFVVRPSMVLSKDEGYMKLGLSLLMATVRVDRLAGVMVDVAVNGSQRLIWENEAIISFKS